MNVYFIVPSDDNLPHKSMAKLKEGVDKVIVVHHKGKLSDPKLLKLLQNDPAQKILAVDPAPFEWDMDAETLRNVPNVVAVCPSSTSFDWIKPKALHKLGILGCNCPGFSADSVAEYAICMAIESARKLPITIKNGWSLPWLERGMLLKGKTLGVVGLGRIGLRVAEIGQGIGMNVVYWSRNTTDQRFTQLTDLDDLFRQVDVLIPTLVENAETKQLITKKRINMLQPHVIWVGINRIRVLWDEQYVIEKVNKAELGGYAYEGEDRQDITVYQGNVWSLPAVAWQTQDSLDTLLDIWVENMLALQRGKPQNVVT